MTESNVYDKGEYHMLGLKTDPPSWEDACGHILFFLRWIIENDLLSEQFRDDEREILAAYRAGSTSLFQFFEERCDMVLDSKMFSDQGNAFARTYFDYDTGRYIDDLWGMLGGVPKPHYIRLTDEAYARFRPTLDERYAAWKSGDTAVLTKQKKPKWWRFWK